MNILGPDSLLFGVDDLDACTKYLTDYGLQALDSSSAGARFEAMDGTFIEVRHKDDGALPPAMDGASMLRKTVYGVADAATLEAIATELGKDRAVKTLSDGSLEVADNMGFLLGFQITIRRRIEAPGELINAPGAPPQRKANVLAVSEEAVIVPRTLSHVVYFVPDAVQAEAFYTRLGFRCTDRFLGTGPFLQPGRVVRSSHPVFDSNTALHERLRAFHFSLGRSYRGAAGGHALREQGICVFLGARPSQIWLELVLVLQQPLRVPCGI